MAEAMIKTEQPMDPELVQPAKGTGRPRGRPRDPLPRHKRLSHSQAEARRRAKIKAGFAALEALIHTDRIQAARARDLEKTDRDSKKTAVTQAMILEEGAEYLLAQERLCKQLAAEENQKIQLQRQLQQTKQQLQAQLDQLRATNRQEVQEEDVSPEEGAFGEPFNNDLDLDLMQFIDGGDHGPYEMMEFGEPEWPPNPEPAVVEQDTSTRVVGGVWLLQEPAQHHHDVHRAGHPGGADRTARDGREHSVSDLFDQFSLPVVTEAVPQHDPMLPSFWDEPSPLVAVHSILS